MANEIKRGDFEVLINEEGQWICPCKEKGKAWSTGTPIYAMAMHIANHLGIKTFKPFKIKISLVKEKEKTTEKL